MSATSQVQLRLRTTYVDGCGRGGAYVRQQTPTQRADSFHRDFFGYVAHLNHFLGLLARPEFQCEINKAKESFKIYSDLVTGRHAEVRKKAAEYVARAKANQASIAAAAAAASKGGQGDNRVHGFAGFGVNIPSKRVKLEPVASAAAAQETSPRSPPSPSADDDDDDDELDGAYDGGAGGRFAAVQLP